MNLTLRCIIISQLLAFAPGTAWALESIGRYTFKNGANLIYDWQHKNIYFETESGYRRLISSFNEIGGYDISGGKADSGQTYNPDGTYDHANFFLDGTLFLVAQNGLVIELAKVPLDVLSRPDFKRAYADAKAIRKDGIFATISYKYSNVRKKENGVTFLHLTDGRVTTLPFHILDADATDDGFDLKIPGFQSGHLSLKDGVFRAINKRGKKIVHKLEFHPSTVVQKKIGLGVVFNTRNEAEEGSEFSAYVDKSVEGKSEIGFVGDGRVIPLPAMDEPVQSHSAYFEAEGRRYIVLTLEYDDGADSHNGGETFILRDDGLFLRYGLTFISEPEPEIYDGILSIGDEVRRIDLRAFKAESRFRVRLQAESILDEEGEEIDDLLQFVKERFRDLKAEAAQAQSTFTVNPEEFEGIRNALGRREAGSVVVTGDAGTGKTELVRAFAAAVGKGKIRGIPRTTQILELTTSGLAQGTKYLGALESKINCLAEAAKVMSTIVFMDEIHSFRGIGTHSGQQNDMFQSLKPTLASGTLRVIGTSTDEEFYHHFAGDAALMRRFSVVKKSPVALELMPTILSNWLKRYSLPEQPSEVLQEGLRISSEWNAFGAQPAKATALLDYAISYLEGRGENNGVLTVDLLNEAAQKFYNIDSVWYSSKERMLRLGQLRKSLDASVIGQDFYKRALVDLTTQFFTNTHDHSKPPIRILVVGPVGVGKSEAAKVYAKDLGLPFTLIDMTRFTASDPRQFLKEMAAAIRKNPYGVILLDELREANLDVQNALLGVLNDGYFSVDEAMDSTFASNSGVVKVDARRAIIIATTNAGAESIKKIAQGSGFGFQSIENPRSGASNFDHEVMQDLRGIVADDGLATPLVNRFQVVVPGLPPTKEEFTEVLLLHLDRALKEMEVQAKVEIKFNPKERSAFLTLMVEKYYRDGMSNRVSQEIIQNYVRSAVARTLLADNELKVVKLKFDQCSGTFAN